MYTNGSTVLADQIHETTENDSKISIDSRPIQKLVPESNAANEPGITLRSDGNLSTETVSHRFFVHAPDSSANVSFATPLGLEMGPSGSEIKVSPPFNATNVPGCYAVGDVGSPFKNVNLALSGGSLASVGANMDLF